MQKSIGVEFTGPVPVFIRGDSLKNYLTKRTLLEAVTQVERQYLFEGVNEVSEACAQR